jgi:hypothetical protein
MLFLISPLIQPISVFVLFVQLACPITITLTLIPTPALTLTLRTPNLEFRLRLRLVTAHAFSLVSAKCYFGRPEDL